MDKPRLGLISLGCPKNLVDTEVLLGKAAEREYAICADPSQADIVVINTCTFIDEARDESLQTINEVVRWKEEGLVKEVIVTGCMAQSWGERIREKVPGVDAIIGMSEYERFGDVLDQVAAARKEATAAQAPWRTLVSEDTSYEVGAQTGRLRVTPRHYAYLKISEGCSNACTFCAIPNFRGLFRSKPWDSVMTEARELVADGARELNLISQDTTDYGSDLSGPGAAGLGALIEELAGLDELRWMRILYAYPGHLSDQLIQTMASCEKLVPYLDMPIQHINSRMLKRMGRRHSREETSALLEKLRGEIPDIVLRTTFIVGFPGETEAEFEELLGFIEQFRFERLGVFAYSHESGTPAGERFPDDIPAEVKAERVHRAMLLQQKNAFAWSESQVGRTLQAVIERPILDDAGVIIPGLVEARTCFDAPEIDPMLRLSGAEALAPGTFVHATISAAKDYDLEGRVASVLAAGRAPSGFSV